MRRTAYVLRTLGTIGPLQVLLQLFTFAALPWNGEAVSGFSASSHGIFLAQALGWLTLACYCNESKGIKICSTILAALLLLALIAKKFATLSQLVNAHLWASSSLFAHFRRLYYNCRGHASSCYRSAIGWTTSGGKVVNCELLGTSSILGLDTLHR